MPVEISNKRIYHNVILLISYVLIGKMALTIAIIPGYPSTISPSAGIALSALLIWGYRLIPGVFFGSVILTFWDNIDSINHSLHLSELVLATALGTTLQAFFGSWLVRRYIGFPSTLSKEKDILIFMLTAGPLACTVNASFVVTSQLLTNEININLYAYTWFYHWIGDSIGVLIASPLVFILFSSPRKLWWDRRLTVVPVLIFVFLITVTMAILLTKWEHERLEFEFKEAASETIDRIHAGIINYLDAVTAVERFITSSPQISRQQFNTFVEKMITEKPGLHGLSWNPLITQQERADFEKDIRSKGFTNFKITQRNKNGELIKAPPKKQYVVVNFIEPMSKNQKAFGFDVSSNLKRLDAMNKARDTGRPVATEKITLVQENAKQAGFLLFYPVYDMPSSSISERINNLRGFAVGIFRVGEIIDRVLSTQNKSAIDIGIYDKISPSVNQALYGPESSEYFNHSIFKTTNDFTIGERHWKVYLGSSKLYLNRFSQWQTGVLLLTGLTFIIISGTFILAMTGRSYRLDKQVKQRTEQIEKQQIKLILTNETLQKIIKELELSNHELDQYAFVASHDLKSPLQSIFQLASWIEEDCNDLLPTDSQRHLSLLKERIKRMEKLLADLLVFSQISRDDYKVESVNIEQLVRRAYTFNSIPEAFELITEHCNIQLLAARIPLELALRNLLNNAVKHHDKEFGTITVSYFTEFDEHILTVADNGPGISPRLQQTSLKMFHTLKSRDEVEGSGLGLSIVKKSLERLGGRVEIHSDGQRGTKITLIWPIRVREVK